MSGEVEGEEEVGGEEVVVMSGEMEGVEEVVMSGEVEGEVVMSGEGEVEEEGLANLPIL